MGAVDAFEIPVKLPRSVEVTPEELKKAIPETLSRPTTESG
jgi:hypothetical protein